VRALVVRPARPAGFEHGLHVHSAVATWTADGLTVELPAEREEPLELEVAFDSPRMAAAAGKPPAWAGAVARRALVEARDRWLRQPRLAPGSTLLCLDCDHSAGSFGNDR
jgi:hypothetical protein